jgi:hypothetical protein
MVKNFALAAIVALFATTTFAETKTETKTEEHKATVVEEKTDATKPAATDAEAKKDEAKK